MIPYIIYGIITCCFYININIDHILQLTIVTNTANIYHILYYGKGYYGIHKIKVFIN